MRPTRLEWFVALIGFLFCIGGILLLPKNFNIAITTISFFGVVFLTAVITIFGKIRASKFQNQSVSVAGGINIRPSRFRIFLLSFTLIFSGGVLFYFGDHYPVIIKILSFIIFATGVILLLLLVMKIIPADYIRFESTGFILGRRWGEVCIPWSEISDCQPGDMHSNQAVFLWINSLAHLEVIPQERFSTIQKEVQTNQESMGFHFMILTGLYGIYAPVLSEAIKRYRAEMCQSHFLA